MCVLCVVCVCCVCVVCVYVCVVCVHAWGGGGVSIDSQMAEWILKLCRYDHSVPAMVFNQTYFKMSPLVGEEGI